MEFERPRGSRGPRARDPEVLIRARDIEVGYEEGPPVLEGVSFDVHAGEVFAILGGSGSGKTTLLRVLLGLLAPRHGRLEVAGRPLAGAKEGERREVLKSVGVLFQTGALLGSLTLAENVMLPLTAHADLPPSTIHLVACLKLALVGLQGSEELVPSEISGGMRKRAGIARAMALDPRILVLDEPSSGLDPVTAQELDRLILTLNRSLGITVLMVTHDLASTFNVAERCLLIDRELRGVLATGTPAEMREHPDERVRNFFHRAA